MSLLLRLGLNHLIEFHLRLLRQSIQLLLHRLLLQKKQKRYNHQHQIHQHLLFLWHYIYYYLRLRLQFEFHLYHFDYYLHDLNNNHLIILLVYHHMILHQLFHNYHIRFHRHRLHILPAHTHLRPHIPAQPGQGGARHLREHTLGAGQGAQAFHLHPPEQGVGTVILAQQGFGQPTPMNNETWICPMCGSASTSKFCPNCGAQKQN